MKLASANPSRRMPERPKAMPSRRDHREMDAGAEATADQDEERRAQLQTGD
jgi:hypothetical protein